ncbi:Zinc finger AN1 domain-containing stress-associated 12 -like protein [Gossypium arboreum]|uniref:Zinc finger AN1 domain-containing stress-associated 12-like protein n=1 Tax=Gossypium arboreum TaxID=29729 RepID=A0A0B0NRY3_GOSAR|nr:zinc finger AN1 domain-containing stress-associated protein 12 [Gossypium arboreum]KHG15615.1 Zinc finger AN1 domain-containing stress-associated 12 -like protein [Gossypium arboreum]
MAGGTEAFPDLGKHCQLSGCHQLDFLPFKCQACHKVFCVEHRSCKSHECPEPEHNSRKVIICEICSTSIEITGKEDQEKMILDKHEKSGNCDPRKKKKPTCPVKRCKETLTFSNRTICKTCRLEVCLKHRFPADHACKQASSSTTPAAADRGSWNEKFLVAFGLRNGKDCGKSGRPSSSTTPSLKAY